MMWLGLLVIIFSMTIVITTSQQSDATPYNNFISIIRSDTCEKSNCIKVAELIQHDTSEQRISGKFIKSGDDYTRAKGMPNGINWYFSMKPGQPVIFVEPDQSALVRSKTITLVPNLKEYTPPIPLIKDYSSWNTTKRTTYTGVYVDDKCNAAQVGVKQNINLTKVINHLLSDCKTDLGNKNIIIEKKTDLKFCGQECQHQKFMKEAKQKAKTFLINPALELKRQNDKIH